MHRSSIVGAATVLSLALAGCSGSGSGPKTIQIGLISSITGVAASTGQQEEQGAQLAAELINKAGGINGVKVNVVVCDDKYDPAATATCYRNLVQKNKVVAIAGSTSSAGELALIPVAANTKVPNVSFAALTGDYLKKPPPWSFAMYPASPIEAAALLNYLKGAGYKKIGIIHDSVPYATGLEALIKSGAQQNGMSVVADEQYQPNDTNFTPQLTKIRTAGADVLLQLGGSIPPAIIAKDKGQLGMTIPMVSGSAVFGVGLKKFISIAGAPATDGISASLSTLDVASTLSASDPRTAPVQKFVAAFKAKHNAAPVNYNGIAYDAMNLIFDAIKRAGTDPSKVRDALEATNNYVGTTAVVTFSKTNHIGPTAESLVMATVKDGAVVAVKSK